MNKIHRINKIIKEACEQSNRLNIPKLDKIINFKSKITNYFTIDMNLKLINV